MGREIEIKLPVPDTAPTLRRLLALQAREIEQVLETNLFFDRPDASLRAGHGALRVRLFDRGGKRDSAGLLTYKTGARGGAMHNRESYDVTIDPAAECIDLLNALGYRQTLGFEKRRHSFHLDDCRVELDELPAGLGRYVEVEGPDEEAVKKVTEKLGLGAIANQKTTYLAMISETLRACPQPENMLKF